MNVADGLTDGIVSSTILGMVATCAGVEAVLVSDWSWRVPYAVAATVCAVVAALIWHGAWLMPSESSEESDES